MFLTDEGYQLRLWPTSQGAIDAVRRERPDLVMLDLWLGGFASGWDILDQIRADATTADIPVLVVSADSRALEERAATLEARRCKVLAKPFRLDDLLGKVSATMNQ